MLLEELTRFDAPKGDVRSFVVIPRTFPFDYPPALPVFHDPHQKVTLDAALTPRTWRITHNSQGDNNEGLEYLGDTVIKCCLSVILYSQFPNAGVGTMTTLRNRLSSGRQLAHMAVIYSIHELARAPEKSRRNPDNGLLENLFESFAYVRNWLSDVFQPWINTQYEDLHPPEKELQHATIQSASESTQLPAVLKMTDGAVYPATGWEPLASVRSVPAIDSISNLRDIIFPAICAWKPCPPLPRNIPPDYPPPLPPLDEPSHQVWLREALTHRSWRSSAHGRDAANDRLAWMGSGLAYLAFADAIFHRYPRAHESQLSLMRERCLSAQLWAHLALIFRFDKALRTMTWPQTVVERATGSQIVKTVLQAFVAVIYLGYGWERASSWMTELFDPWLDLGFVEIAPPETTHPQEGSASDSPSRTVMPSFTASPSGPAETTPESEERPAPVRVGPGKRPRDADVNGIRYRKRQKRSPLPALDATASSRDVGREPAVPLALPAT